MTINLKATLNLNLTNAFRQNYNKTNCATCTKWHLTCNTKNSITTTKQTGSISTKCNYVEQAWEMYVLIIIWLFGVISFTVFLFPFNISVRSDWWHMHWFTSKTKATPQCKNSQYLKNRAFVKPVYACAIFWSSKGEIYTLQSPLSVIGCVVVLYLRHLNALVTMEEAVEKHDQGKPQNGPHWTHVQDCCLQSPGPEVECILGTLQGQPLVSCCPVGVSETWWMAEKRQ